jgi:hypothetical protein
MRRPMSYLEAFEAHACQECLNGYHCEFDCVRSSTCSMPCPSCGERNWFSGDLHRAPAEFPCRYCGKTIKNRFGKNRRVTK